MTENDGVTLATLRQQAKSLHAEGRPIDAINLQLKVIQLAGQQGGVPIEDYNRIGIMFFAVQDFVNAVAAFEKVYQQDANYKSVALNLGLCLIRLNRYAQAIEKLKIAENESPDDLNLLDGLAEVCWKAGDKDGSRHYGERSLTVKDSLVCQKQTQSWTIPKQAPPAFNSKTPEKHVISFSLFGNQERYFTGAIKNVLAAKEHYPQWHCRFYCDDQVPRKVISEIKKLGGVVVMMPRPQRPSDGLFWRFLVAEDKHVSRFLIRDCDSVINRREKFAVNEWLASGQYFHLMRDNCSHTDLMLAGLWGGVAGVLPPLAQLLTGYAYNPVTESRTADQKFLGQIVWPIIKNDCLIHDKIFRVFGAKDFPPGSDLVQGRHVGDNDFAFN